MAINYETFKDGGFKYALLKLKALIDTLLSTKYDKTGGNISGNVDIDGNLTLNIPDDDYVSGIRFTKALDNNLGTVLTLTGFANSQSGDTNYRPLIRNVATPNSNYDVANKKYVDDNIVRPISYFVFLNPDGTIDTYSSQLNYSTVKGYLTSLTTTVYLDVIQGTSRFYVSAVQDMDTNNGPVKFIGLYNKDNNKCLIEFDLDTNNTLSVQITVLESIWNKVNDIIGNSTSTLYYPSTKAVYDQFQRKPVVIWQESTPANYLKAITANISASPAWQLTNLDMTPFKRIKIYSCAGQATGSTASASTTAAMILEMSLDSRAAIAAYGGNYVGSIISQKPNDNNRLATLTCAVSADKTSFVVLRQTNLYGTGATQNNDVNANVFMIEGYYD